MSFPDTEVIPIEFNHLPPASEKNSQQKISSHRKLVMFSFNFGKDRPSALGTGYPINFSRPL